MTPRGAWSDFWASASSDACLPNAPPPVRTALATAWADFATMLPSAGRVLDIASGNGAVLRALREARRDLVLEGIDYADVGPAARGLGIRGGIDADALPFAEASFDAVTSQFGIEYCPAGAVAEASRVLRVGGYLLLIIHHAASPAIAHNRARHAAMAALDEAGLFALAQRVAAGQPEDPRTAEAIALSRRRHAAQSISDELPMAIGQVLQRGGGIAGVATIEARVRAELARLAAMIAAARNDDGIAVIADGLGAAGCVVHAAPLRTAAGEIVAWQVSGTRDR
ncbi:class I SAM-dependent methyltransferase [Glacieibacterium frigidum]|uniref:Class I SAM-dependent methyltransferase n=1 Tax=Glacieibacterium frigidum TaxID=2593303 RepID=A0A552U7L0_9SPHN|nr:class I SAM-dependent methyltransferase [Glacieibacterium frigidum]TRW14200.1 class I SAM-dependent methyltransferase [Glacieibacterium frigidum]